MLPSQENELRTHVLQRSKILIIDDSLDVVKALELFFEELGCRVFVAVSPEDGMTLARIHRFKLILIDIRMPGMCGDEVLSKIKYISPSIPIIMMTGYEDEKSARRCMEMGAYDFIRKPFDFEYLETTALSTILSS